MTKPLVSVIVATYNHERFIGRCLRSLLRQSMPHEQYEIIVINDGSVDRTDFALELFSDSIRLITNDKNMGLPYSINLGIKSAKSDFIVRVDSDDYVNANFLYFLYFFLNQNPQFDAVACDYLLVDDSELILKRLSSKENPIACGIMFKKQDLMNIGLYDENFRCQEEKELRIRFEKIYKIERLPIPLYRYRRHENNITNDVGAMEASLQELNKKHGNHN